MALAGDCREHDVRTRPTLSRPVAGCLATRSGQNHPGLLVTTAEARPQNMDLAGVRLVGGLPLNVVAGACRFYGPEAPPARTAPEFAAPESQRGLHSQPNGAPSIEPPEKLRGDRGDPEVVDQGARPPGLDHRRRRRPLDIWQSKTDHEPVILDCPAPRTIIRMRPDLVVAQASNRAIAVQLAAAVALRWPDAIVTITTTEVEVHADARRCRTGLDADDWGAVVIRTSPRIEEGGLCKAMIRSASDQTPMSMQTVVEMYGRQRPADFARRWRGEE